MKRWAERDEAEREEVLRWVVSTCRTFGAPLGTAYTVAGMFASGLDRETGVVS